MVQLGIKHVKKILGPEYKEAYGESSMGMYG